MATTMIERHYDDEALISLIENEPRQPRTRTCPAASRAAQKIESFRMIADALVRSATSGTARSGTEPVPATIANLRAFADRMTDEDARAEAILRELLAGSREEWMPRLRAHPEWRTAGVVRKLIAQVYTAVVAMPPDAVEIDRPRHVDRRGARSRGSPHGYGRAVARCGLAGQGVRAVLRRQVFRSGNSASCLGKSLWFLCHQRVRTGQAGSRQGAGAASVRDGSPKRAKRPWPAPGRSSSTAI